LAALVVVVCDNPGEFNNPVDRENKNSIWHDTSVMGSCKETGSGGELNYWTNETCWKCDRPTVTLKGEGKDVEVDSGTTAGWVKFKELTLQSGGSGDWQKLLDVKGEVGETFDATATLKMTDGSEVSLKEWPKVDKYIIEYTVTKTCNNRNKNSNTVERYLKVNPMPDLSELTIVALDGKDQTVKENDAKDWNKAGVIIYKNNAPVTVEDALDKVTVKVVVGSSYSQEYSKPVDLSAVKLPSTAKAGDKYVITYSASYEGKKATLEISVTIVEGAVSLVEPVIVLNPYRPTLTGKAVDAVDTMMTVGSTDNNYVEKGVKSVYYEKGGSKVEIKGVDSTWRQTPFITNMRSSSARKVNYRVNGDGANYSLKTETRTVYLVGGDACEDEDGRIDKTPPEITFKGPDNIAAGMSWYGKGVDTSWAVTNKDIAGDGTEGYKYYIDFAGLDPRKPVANTYKITYVGLGKCGGTITKERTITVK